MMRIGCTIALVWRGMTTGLLVFNYTLAYCPGPACYIPNDTRRSRSRDLGRSLRRASESRINDFAHFRGFRGGGILSLLLSTGVAFFGYEAGRMTS